MKHCPNCGKVNPDACMRCAYCNHDISNVAPDINPDQQNRDASQQPHNPYSQSYNFNAELYYARNNAFDSDALGKSRGIFALLAILIGSLGIHYFYIGKYVGGLITIGLCIVTCGLWSLIPFIQGIVAFCSDNYTFDKRFVYSTSVFPVF